jgi:threonine aldolase
VGSLLLSSLENNKKARRIRKVFGGAMRQAGYLAAAGIYALDHNIDRLKDDHLKARQIGLILSSCPVVEQVQSVDTNIVIFTLQAGVAVNSFLAKLRNKNIHAIGFGDNSIRMVTHLDIKYDMLNDFEKGIKSI